MSRYVVAVRAPSAVRLPPDRQVCVDVRTAHGPARATVRTGYQAFGDGVVPRFLWTEVVGEAPGLVPARETFQALADELASLMCLTMNAAIESAMPTVAFDADEQASDHEFWQLVIDDERGLPRPGRLLNERAFDSVAGAMEVTPHRSQIELALGNYRQAMLHAHPGEWLLAVAHAWIGFEALKPVVLDQELERSGMSRAQLAAAWGVRTSVLANEARLRLLFGSRATLHSSAKETSDHLEHALSSFGPLQQRATKDATTLVGLLRRCTLRAIYAPKPVPRPLRAAALREPLPCVQLQRQIHAVLAGRAEALAPDDLQYPHFDLASQARDIELHDDGRYTLRQDVTMTARLGPGVQARNFRYEVWGPPGMPT